MLLSSNMITKSSFDCNLNVTVIHFYLEISIKEGKPIKKVYIAKIIKTLAIWYRYWIKYFIDVFAFLVIWEL